MLKAGTMSMTKAQYLANPEMALELARAHGPVVVIGEDGKPIMTLSVLRALDNEEKLVLVVEQKPGEPTHDEKWRASLDRSARGEFAPK